MIKKISKATKEKILKSERRKKLIEWSKAVRNRDGNQCVLCHSKEHIQAHHILHKKMYPELMFDIDNGISLCAKHHIFGKESVHNGTALILFLWLQNNRDKQVAHLTTWLLKHHHLYFF